MCYPSTETWPMIRGAFCAAQLFSIKGDFVSLDFLASAYGLQSEQIPVLLWYSEVKRNSLLL
jgi:hypothetical protein